MTPKLSRTLLALAAAALALGGAACNQRPADAPVAARHDAVTGDPSCAGPTVHDKHVATFRCDVCHPSGAQFGFDLPYTFPRGTTTAGGTLVRTAGTPPSCTVACHFPNGAAAHAITWDTPGPLACTACHDTARLPSTHPAVTANATRSDCQACHQTTGHTDGTVQLSGHPVAWMDQTNPGFHASSANQGLATCQGCHGADLTGGSAGVSCGSCHDSALPAGVTSWVRNCTMCHGGTDSQTGAPPKATWGNAGDPIRVGAHTRHLAGSAIAPAFDCGVCHQKPTDAFTTGHIDAGTAQVAFGGIAASGAPAWDRTTATCAVYCHGATLNAGGTNTAPSWTGGPVACGECHGTPPPAPHPAVADLTGCVTCHPQTMDATGAVIPPSAGGLHLDGVLEVSGTHAAGWTDPASPNFHALSANRGLDACQQCHGPALDGVGGTVALGCNQCHGAAWKTSCTMCHGGTDNPTGAPPRATWGSASAVAVGAHSSHVGTNPVSAPIACAECHPTPTDALSPGHVSGSVAVSFAGAVSGLAAGGSWNYPALGTPTCSSTYCHGNFKRGNATTAPDWNGANQAACGSCHPARPGSYLHLRHQRETLPGVQPWWPLPGGSTFVTCDQCHSGIAESVSNLGTPTLTLVNGSGPILHVNGTPDVVLKGGGSYVVDPYAGTGTCSSMTCHPGDVKYWPR
jgi:predicted CxxxxCH...CXXCH cytochrome family protein